MTQFVIPNRPFATEPITELMTPDGIFEVALGQQHINAHVKNNGTAETNVQIYIESVADPGIVVTPATYYLANAEQSAAHLFTWQADFTGATPGKHLVSFIVQTAAGHQRILKYIWVTRMNFNPATHSFSITTPEGVLDVAFKEMIGPAHPNCCRPKQNCDCGCDKSRTLADVFLTAARLQETSGQSGNLLGYLAQGFRTNSSDFTLCAPQVLIDTLAAQVKPTPPYKGQYGDLPFSDPWWKVLLAILAFLLLVAAAIAEAVDGKGDLTAGAGGTHDVPNGGGGSCCTPQASGGGTSKVAAGLLAAAAAVATVAGASDVRDPFRKGADKTAPATPDELTTSEELKLSFAYPEPIVPGKPFKVGTEWEYTRVTTASSYTYTTNETNANIHTLSKYAIHAPNVVRAYKRELFIVKAEFYDADNKIFKGDQLFVQCFLIGPAGQWRRFTLQDNGVSVDDKANDGTYTGATRFSIEDVGLWKYFVIAQDINQAQPDMKPEQAAQLIGGMLLTHQLTITFDGGTCPLVPDGDVNVLA